MRSIHSKDGRTSADRLKRISELSALKREMRFNNIGHHVNQETLIKAFRGLDGSKALGVDKITKEIYGGDLLANSYELINSIRKGTYKPAPMRIVEILKDDGGTRPLAISCVEDKIVQRCVADILTAIYEPLFLACSYGFRPNRNCHDAITDLARATYVARDGATVEIDIKQCFNSIPHPQMMEFLRAKIADERFLRLIEVMLAAPILTKDGIKVSDIGIPQGSCLSPILANVYLHHVVDQWFTDINKSHLGNAGKCIRFADDMVFVFDNRIDAEKFLAVLPKRLGKYGLHLNEEKSSLVESGPNAAKRAHASKNRIPTYKFLGFTFYWGMADREKFWRLKVKSRGDRLRRALRGIKKYLFERLANPDLDVFLKGFIARVRGWVNYHAVTDNRNRVKGFLKQCERMLLRWFRRRGSGRRGMTMAKLVELLQRYGFPYKFKIKSLFNSPIGSKGA